MSVKVSKQLKQKVGEVLSSYQHNPSMLVSILQDVQKVYNHLPREALVEVSHSLNVPLTQVYSVDLDLADSFARPGMLTVWQTILQTVETAVDRLTKAGTFNLAFRRACIVLAADYPFLDPFAREFAYREGQITFEGKATIAQFNAGLSRCLAQAVRDLATLPTTPDVLTHLHAATTRLRDESYSQLEQLGLTAALPEVFGP
jgi:hypothetical protein